MTNRKPIWLIVLTLSCLVPSCEKKQESPVSAAQSSEKKEAANEVRLTSQARAEQKVVVAPVVRGVAVLPERARGRIALPDNAIWRVGVLVEGRVGQVYANLGDLVKKGQVLARMHSHEVHTARADYANALAEQSRLKAAEELARKNYERSEKLYTLKAEALADTEVARQQLVNAETQTREASNVVTREEAHLTEILGLAPKPSGGDEADLLPITAPADGRVLQKNVTPGATISPSTDTFVIGDLRRLWMLASVDAATLSKLRVGQPARVFIPDVPDQTYAGVITNLGQEFDPTTRLIQIRIEIKHPDARLRPEMLATAEFDIHAGTPTLEVPQEAIQQVNGQDVLFVQVAADRFRVQPVELGPVIENRVRVLKGLEPRDQIITRGSFIAKGQLLKASIGE